MSDILDIARDELVTAAIIWYCDHVLYISDTSKRLKRAIEQYNNVRDLELQAAKLWKNRGAQTQGEPHP